MLENNAALTKNGTLFSSYRIFLTLLMLVCVTLVPVPQSLNLRVLKLLVSERQFAGKTTDIYGHEVNFPCLVSETKKGISILLATWMGSC